MGARTIHSLILSESIQEARDLYCSISTPMSANSFNGNQEQETLTHSIMSHLANPLATPEQLYQRRSFSSLPVELQDAIFFSTQCLTQAAGVLLQLPQSITAQANVVLARYWLVEPFMAYEFSVCALAFGSHVHLLTTSRMSLLRPSTSLRKSAPPLDRHAMFPTSTHTFSPEAPPSSGRPHRRPHPTIQALTFSRTPPTSRSTTASLRSRPAYYMRWVSTHTFHCLILWLSHICKHWSFWVFARRRSRSA